MNLRDTLLQALGGLPGTRQFHLHVLVSAPRKHASLYPFAVPHPKTFLQHILVLLSEQVGDGPRVFVTAIEACLYHLPTTSSAVLYVSKVDSTGQAIAPSPTPVLVRALVAYYVDPTTRPVSVDHVWVHLFARAQSQYLFPNSGAFSGKRPLTDMKLCAWWKRQLGIVAEEVSARAAVRLYYLLPGLGEAEASQAVDRVYAGGSAAWRYGHPYGEGVVPSGRGGHLGEVIPWFDDDPKARFLDEIAYTTDAEGVKSPERKRARTGREEEAKKEERTRMDKVGVDEFWERMGFRQECVAGAMTGFFVMATSCPTTGGCTQPGLVSGQVVQRVLSSLMTGHDFATVERAVWSTRVLEESIRGLCEGNVDVYGSVTVANAAQVRSAVAAEQITVLSVRRKKRGRV